MDNYQAMSDTAASAPIAASYAPGGSRLAGQNLFLVGFLVMFLELACIRWFGPHYRWFFRIARASWSAREIGADWYNGARHLDEQPTSRLVARWLRSVVLGGKS